MTETITPVNRVLDLAEPITPDTRIERLPPAQTAFERLRDKRWHALPFREARPTSGDLELVQFVTPSIAQIKDHADEWNAAIQSIVAHGVEIRLAKPDAKLFGDILKQKLAELKPLVPVVPAEPATFLCARLFDQPQEDVFKSLQQALWGQLCALYGSVEQAFATLLKNRLVGSIEWGKVKEKVCCYHYYRPVVIHEDMPETTTVETFERYVGSKLKGGYIERTSAVIRKTTKERPKQRTHRHARHEHHVVNANRHLPGDRAVRKPKFIEALIASLPAWLTEEVCVVAGDMVREQIVEVDARVDRWVEKEESETKIGEVTRQGELISPAVLLGNVVLAGWSGSDLK